MGAINCLGQCLVVLDFGEYLQDRYFRHGNPVVR